MSLEFEELLISEVRKRPVITDVLVAKELKGVENEIDAAFFIAGLKNTWSYLSKNKDILNQVINSETSNESNNDRSSTDASVQEFQQNTNRLKKLKWPDEASTASSESSFKQFKKYLKKRSKKSKKSNGKKLIKFPKMDEFAKRKVEELKAIDVQFKKTKKTFDKSCKGMSKDDVTSPTLPIIWEKFMKIHPTQYDACTKEIINEIVKNTITDQNHI